MCRTHARQCPLSSKRSRSHCFGCLAFPSTSDDPPSGLHFANLAFAYTNTVAIFGGSAWFTGGMICVWMMLIYSATPENTRRGQFEVFWYSHHWHVHTH